MEKLIGKWEMVPEKTEAPIKALRRNNTYTIKKVEKNKMMIQSEWVTTDNKSGFVGYTVQADGIPRRDFSSDTKMVAKFRGKNVLTTSKFKDDQVESMVIREVLDSGEMRLTKIDVSPKGEQVKYIQYYKKVD